MAFASTESGRTEVYVQSLPPATGRWQVSVNGGGQPRWRGDGKELFFLSLGGKMMAVDMSLGTRVAAGVPRELFQTAISSVAIGHYDVSTDGRKFLIYSPPGGVGSNTPITVVLNWWLELRK
jgi:Tol biopolymer transport system component